MAAWMAGLIMLLLASSPLVLAAGLAAENTDADVNQERGGGNVKNLEMVPEEDFSNRLLIDTIQEAIDNITSKIPDLHLPALPATPLGTVTIGMVDLSLTGLNRVDVARVWAGTGAGTRFSVTLNVPRVALTAEHYSAGGYVLNLPFNGEGPFSLILHDLKIEMSFEWRTYSLLSPNFCVQENSTAIDLDLRRMQVNFENLNPGSDQGELINTMMSSVGPDIFDYLETFLDTTLYHGIDQAIVNAVNAKSCKDAKVEQVEVEVWSIEQLEEALIPNMVPRADQNDATQTINELVEEVRKTSNRVEERIKNMYTYWVESDEER